MRLRERLIVKAIACVLIYAIEMLPLARAASAAATDISDLPLAAAKRPNPNLALVIDDSGSTDDEVSFNANDGASWWHTGDGRFHGRNTTDTVDFASRAWGGTGTLNYNMAGSRAHPGRNMCICSPTATAAGIATRVLTRI